MNPDAKLELPTPPEALPQEPAEDRRVDDFPLRDADHGSEADQAIRAWQND